MFDAKMPRAERRRRAMLAIPLVLGIILIGLAAAYPLADLSRDRLDDDARAALLRAGQASQFVGVTSGVMHVRVSGPADGPVVLLIHGGVIGGHAYEHWRKPLGDAGYRVIVPDLLGYGYSDRPNTPYAKAFYTTQLDDLLAGLGVSGRVHVVGASMGGAIAAAFAAHAPDRVRSVTLIAPAGGGRHPVVSETLLQPVLGDWVFRVFGPASTQRMMRKAYPPSADRDALVAWMAEQGRFRGFGEGLLNTLRRYDVLWQPEDYQALGRSGLPVLAVWGTADAVNPFAQSTALAKWVPQMTLASLRDKPHAITFADAPVVLAVVLPFLEKTDAAERRAATP